MKNRLIKKLILIHELCPICRTEIYTTGIQTERGRDRYKTEFVTCRNEHRFNRCGGKQFKRKYSPHEASVRGINYHSLKENMV